MPLKGFGGLEIQTLMRAKDAIRYGNNAFVLAIRNTRVWKSGLERKLEMIHLAPNWKYLDINSIIQLGKAIQNLRIDSIILPKTELLSNAISAKQIFNSGCKVILYQQMQSGIMKKDFFHNWIYRNLDGAIVLTSQMQEELASTTILNKLKIRAIPYGVEIDSFDSVNHTKSELRHLFGLSEDTFIFGCVARIEPNKDQMTLLQAFIKSGIPNSELVFCGNLDNSSYSETLNRIIETHGLQRQVRIIPFTERIAELMKCFDVFVLPTPAETFGLVLPEAMAAGIPVIGAFGGGIKEIFRNNFNGLHFEPRNIDELSEKLTLLYNDRKLGLELVKNARQTVEEKYNYDKQTEAFFDFCQSC